MKQGLKVKWLSLMVTLFLAFGTVFSVATAVLPEAKAYGSDVTVNVEERYLNAGEEFSFSVFAYSEKGFSSYQLKLEVPDFVKVTGITSRMDGESTNFEYAQKGSTYNITFTSDHNEYGSKTMFDVYAYVDDDAQGRSGTCSIYEAKFTDTNVSQLSVETNSAMFYVYGDSEIAKGDFDGDGEISIQDVMLMQRAIAYELKLSEAQLYAGDIDRNEVLDIYDCQYVRLYLIGAIDDLESIGGEPHHGGDEICETYTEQDGTSQLTINDDLTFMLVTSEGDTFSGYYVSKKGTTVYLVSDYVLKVVYVNVENLTYQNGAVYYFDELSATAENYVGTYFVNDSETDTVTIAENGAFYRTCVEDGYQIQYNGMISILKVIEEKNAVEGVAYIFGTNADDCWMEMPFTLNTERNVIYADNGGNENRYNISFYVNDRYLFSVEAGEGEYYSSIYSRFIEDNSKRLVAEYGAINFDDCYTESGVSVFSDSVVRGNDGIHINAKGQQENWTENESVYDVYWGENSDRLYYGATREDVLGLFVGKTFEVYKVYLSDKGSERDEYFKDVVITADMVGDTSKIDFSGENGSSHVELILTIDGRTAKMSLNLVPDMTGARLVKTGVVENTYYVDGKPRVQYYVIKLYNNGYIEQYYINGDGQINSDANNYIAYATEDYNGTTLYIVYDSTYFVFNGTVTIGRTEYQILTGYKHAEEQETTDYTLTVTGMGKTVFKVFNDEFAEVWSVSRFTGELEYQGTEKVSIENGKFNYLGVIYAIGENNVLSIALPEGEPILSTVIEGADVLFYEGGTAYVTFGGEVMMTMDWESDADLTVISCNLMGEEMYFYKWAKDGEYHSSEEPVWEEALAVYDLVYTKDGVTTNYTLYKFQGSRLYLFDGVTAEHVYDADDNIFYVYAISGESIYYYYNDEGEMYDAVRYHIEDARENHFGYMYAIPAKGIMVGYWQPQYGEPIWDAEFFGYTVNGEGNYVVTYNGNWLYTATSVMATNPTQNNRLVLVDYAGKQENGSGSGEIYGIDLYVIVNGDMNTEPYKISVQSYEEFAGNLKNYSETGYIVEGAFFDEFRKEMVTSDNFRSGNVYLFMTQRG